MTSPAASPVELLRKELARLKLDGFIVPRQDEFQGEYVAARAERLAWISGFTGSWGLAIVLETQAAIFVDGRYTSQVADQTDPHIFAAFSLHDDPPAAWLKRTLKPGQRMGYDPWLTTIADAAKYDAACAKAGASLVALDHNPVDAVWADQPEPTHAPFISHPVQFSGEATGEKLAKLAHALKEQKADALILTQPDSVAWLFNLRGSDIPHTPVVPAFAIVTAQGKATLFADAERLAEDAAALLKGHVSIAAPSALKAALKAMESDKRTILHDPAWTPEAIRLALDMSGATLVAGSDPSVLLKARKNAIEQEGARTAHRRDGVAMVRFLHWLASTPDLLHTELSVAEKLKAFREATGELKDLSFGTISAAGAHAALPHYSVNAESNILLKRNEIYLIDSGGQYLDGTTDITRTLIIGTPTPEMQDRFTRVLKGMIALSVARFPAGTTGSQLDILARQFLWDAGLDFDHGTGHGVGSYLSVHEGPQRINKSDRTKLEPGMILSNEPGYYKLGNFGIRIENLLLVRPAQTPPGGERPMLSFETLTLAPIDRHLIAPALLTTPERDWLNAYHSLVFSELKPLLTSAEAAWLERACERI